jgi:hypothetical protein
MEGFPRATAFAAAVAQWSQNPEQLEQVLTAIGAAIQPPAAASLKTLEATLNKMKAKVEVLHKDFVARFNDECWNTNGKCDSPWKAVKWPCAADGEIPEIGQGLPQSLAHLDVASNDHLVEIIEAYGLSINLTGVDDAEDQRLARLQTVKQFLKVPM